MATAASTTTAAAALRLRMRRVGLPSPPMSTTNTTIRCRRIIHASPRTNAVLHISRRSFSTSDPICINSSKRSSSTTTSTTVVPPVPTAAAASASEAPSSPTLQDNDDDVSPSSSSSSIPAAYMSLAKAKLSALVVATTAAGYVAGAGAVAAPGIAISSQLDVLGSCIVGTALCASSAAAFNQIVEIEQDKLMKRTQQRPLVTGDLTIGQATTAATLWCGAGTSILYYGCDPITAALGLGNVALYAGVYTSMKPRSIYNTWVGALVGAIPPIMGYSAATGGMNIWSVDDLQPWMLASTLYLWQMPHFFALSYMYRADYKRGGFQMVPCLEEDGDETSQLIVRYTWYLSTIPFVAYATNTTSSMFALEGLALNAYFLKQAYQFRHDRTNANARKVFLTSLWYLPCLLMLFLLHSKVWDDEKETSKQQDDDDVISRWLSDTVHRIRNKGRDLCPHEVAIARATTDNEDVSDACPVTIANRKSEQGAEVVIASAVSASSTVADASTEANREV